jgi:hypothetical protein
MDKYKEFLKIAKLLNFELNIIPILYGSLGLSKIIQKDLSSEDIDILVPKKYITTDWNELLKVLQRINYRLVNEKEHELVCRNNKIGIAHEEDLLPFANIDYKNLKTLKEEGIKYKVLNIEQYKRVYEKSKNDSYRSQENNKKDLEKIKLIDDFMKNITCTR